MRPEDKWNRPQPRKRKRYGSRSANSESATPSIPFDSCVGRFDANSEAVLDRPKSGHESSNLPQTSQTSPVSAAGSSNDQSND